VTTTGRQPPKPKQQHPLGLIIIIIIVVKNFFIKVVIMKIIANILIKFRENLQADVDFIFIIEIGRYIQYQGLLYKIIRNSFFQEKF
jgi:hypothetical protein